MALSKITRQKLFLLLLIAVLIRTVFVLIYQYYYGTTQWGDSLEYLSMGRQIAGGTWNPVLSEIVPHMRVAPVLPLVIALFTVLFGNSVIPLYAFNIIVGALSVPVVYHLGKSLFDKRVGLIVAIWAALCIETFSYYARVAKEPILFLLFPLSLLFLVKWIKTGRNYVYFVLSALAMTLVFHTDERFLIYIPILGLLFLLKGKESLFAKFKYFALWMALVFVLMLPWGVRNYKVFDQVVLISPRTTAFTSALFGEQITDLQFSDETIVDNYKVNLKNQADAMEEKYGVRPKAYGKYEAKVRAFIFFWQPTLFKVNYIYYGARVQGPWSWPRNLISLTFFGVFIPFYVIGLFLLIKRRMYIGLLLALIPLIHSLLHAYMVWSLPRYRSPVLFMIAMVGTWAALELFKMARERYLKKSGLA